jgi:hypothetical protein
VERLIVSTGRSGSTLLTKMVAQNRKVLVLSEFMVAMDPVNRFSTQAVSGADFARFMDSTDDIAILVYERAIGISERIKKDGGARRWGPRNIMPSLAATTFPMIAEDPVALFDEAISYARTLPTQSMSAHYLAVFSWLARQLNKQVWIERSGVSMRWLPELRALFPEARYLHIHRSGPEAALSMMSHPWFVLAAQYESEPPPRDAMEKAANSRSRAADDPVGGLYHRVPPVEYFGWAWSYSLLRAYREVSKLDRSQWSDVWFEKLISDPRAELARVAQFFELPEDEGWIDRAAAFAKSEVPLRADTLSADERERLQRACLPGEVLLGRADPNGLATTYQTLRSVMPR